MADDRLVLSSTTTTTAAILQPLYSPPEVDDFDGGKFYCPHALADGI